MIFIFKSLLEASKGHSEKSVKALNPCKEGELYLIEELALFVTVSHTESHNIKGTQSAHSS